MSDEERQDGRGEINIFILGERAVQSEGGESS